MKVLLYPQATSLLAFRKVKEKTKGINIYTHHRDSIYLPTYIEAFSFKKMLPIEGIIRVFS